MQPTEDCDDGGICVGGDNAGMACTSEANCVGTGVCISGPMAERVCATDNDCAGSQCIRCKPVGGDGCAANCTNERDIVLKFIGPGLVGLPDQRGIVIHDDVIRPAVILLNRCKSGSNNDKACQDDSDCPGGTCVDATLILTIGRDRGDGIIPFVVKARNVIIPRIPFSTLACFCIRSVSAKTCGGMLFNNDGSVATNCSEGFGAGPSACTGKQPCAFVHGPGNAATGVLGCGPDGLQGTNLDAEQDCGGSSRMAHPRIVTLSGNGPAGSVTMLASSAVGTVVGGCSGSDPASYGADGEFCTDDDPIETRGSIAMQPMVTGTATGTVHGADGHDGADIGPFSVTGEPFSCDAIIGNVPSSGALASALPACGAPIEGDVVVTSRFLFDVAQAGTPAPTFTPTPPSVCTGDCSGDGQVTIDEIIIGVNIALGAVPISSCPSLNCDPQSNPSALPPINCIMVAINNALNGCERAATPTAPVGP